MEIYSIGFTQTTAERFFGRLADAQVQRLLDVRLNNTSQLAGFAKAADLPYFLRELVGATYEHQPLLAPTKELLDAYKKRNGDWGDYERKKQVIVHDGSNISPLEVESALAEHPAVDLAGVVGVHDEVHGENVRAYVTLRVGAEPPSSADLIVFCRDRVGYKAPEEVVVLDEMPLNPTGKIDRVGLKRMAEDHLHPHGLPDDPP